MLGQQWLQPTFAQQCFCSAAYAEIFNNFGKNLAATHFIPKMLVKIAFHDSYDNFSVVSFIVIQQLLSMVSLILSMFYQWLMC